MHLGRRASVVRTVVTAALGVALIGCGTEPSDFEPGVYRLAAADSLTTDNLPCFASSSRWSGGRLDYQGTCDIALRSLQARFDSAGPVPELVVTARLRLPGGDTTVSEPPGSPLRFDALGSVVGGTLTLFTNYWLLDGRLLASPIVLNSE